MTSVLLCSAATTATAYWTHRYCSGCLGDNATIWCRRYGWRNRHISRLIRWADGSSSWRSRRLISRSTGERRSGLRGWNAGGLVSWCACRRRGGLGSWWACRSIGGLIGWCACRRRGRLGSWCACRLTSGWRWLRRGRRGKDTRIE